MKLLRWKWLKRRVSVKIKRSGYFSYSLDDRHGMSPEAIGRTSRHCCRNSSEKLQLGLVIIKGKRIVQNCDFFQLVMGSHHLKAQLQMQYTGASFCVFLWSSNSLLSKFYYLFMFSPCLNQLIELFRSKENFKEKIDSYNNWKAAWPRMSLDWHLFLWLSLWFVRKILNFVGKHLNFHL